MPMTVEELMEYLIQQDPDANIAILYKDDNFSRYLTLDDLEEYQSTDPLDFGKQILIKV